MQSETKPSDLNGSMPIVTESAPESQQTSKNSGEPSRGLSKQWQQPRNVKEFAAQANRVATLVLSGEIDLETARVYSSIARTVSQSMSTEVQRARISRERPDLEFIKDT